MAFTYGDTQWCKSANGTADKIYQVRFGWQQNSQDNANNKSNITLRLEARSTSSSYTTYGYKQTPTIDGTTLSARTFDFRSTNTWQNFGERTFDVYHNDDGTYSYEKTGSFTTSLTGGRVKSGSASVQVTLPTIPRYTSISSFTVSKRNETSLTFNWQTADTIDYVWYSTNNGSSWTGYDVSDGTSGSFTVSSLSPNTTYTCKLRVRRKDSGLTTDSGAVSQTTNAIPSQSISSKTETTITMNWSCDATASYIQYSIDNGSNWTNVGSVSSSSGSYTISGLSANTTYNIKTRVTRSATGTYYDTSASSQTTYNYPYISAVNSSNLTIGNSQTLTLYNPLSRSCTVYMKKDSSSGTQLYSGSTSGTSITFTPTASTLYSSISNSTSGNCVYYVVCSSPSHTSGTTSGKYVVSEASNKPTLSSSSFLDTNSTTSHLTSNSDTSSKIVLNGSTLQISVTIAGKNYASISTIKIEGSSRTVTAGGSGANLTGSATYSITKPTKSSFSIEATDSRGLTYSGTITIASGNVVNYIPLTIVGVGSRNQPTDGKINLSSSGKYFNDTFGYTTNTLTTTYRWKEEGGSYSGDISLTNTKGTGTHTEAQVQVSGFDYTKNYYFEFKAVDKLNTVTSTVLVTKGVPVFNWDNDEFDINVNANVDGYIKPQSVVSKLYRPSTPNFDHQYPNEKVSKRFDICSSSMSNSGYKPSGDGFLETYFWDNSGMYDTQIFIPNNSSSTPAIRYRNNVNWGNNWKNFLMLETGTWTPEYLNCTVEHYSSMTARYIKFGPLVIATLHDRPNIHNVTGNAMIGGLPYPVQWPQIAGICAVFMPINTSTLPGIQVSNGIGTTTGSGFTFTDSTARGASDTQWRDTGTSNHGNWLEVTAIYWTES